MNHKTGPETYRGVKVPGRFRFDWDSPDSLGWRHGVDASQAPREVTHDAAVAEIKAAARRLESPALEARVLAALDWRSDCEAVPAPPVRGELWSLLDWTFWGSGMGDVVRESLADTMMAAISPEQRAQAVAEPAPNRRHSHGLAAGSATATSAQRCGGVVPGHRSASRGSRTVAFWVRHSAAGGQGSSKSRAAQRRYRSLSRRLWPRRIPAQSVASWRNACPGTKSFFMLTPVPRSRWTRRTRRRPTAWRRRLSGSAGPYAAPSRSGRRRRR